MSRASLRVYIVRDESGLFTGRAIARAETHWRFVVTGKSEEQVFEQLDHAIGSALDGDPDALEAFLWTEELHTAQVLVEVRQETTIEKRTVIGKERIPLRITYAWSEITGERERTAAGYRVLVPRFGWWYVLEELDMAADVLRQAVSAALVGESARSLFDFREAAEERIVDWMPKSARKKRNERESLFGSFVTLEQVAEDWGALARAGRLGAHYGPVEFERYQTLIALEKKPSILLIGPSGVGKTEWVKELARRVGRLSNDDPSAPRLFATSADRIMAGMQYLGMWEQRCLDIVAELSSEGHWLYVDRLAALARERTGASSIADLFLPALTDGEISLIAEATEQELARLAVRAPALLACFELVRLEPSTPERVAALIVEHQERRNAPARLAADATRRLVRHLGSFRKDRAFPGKAFSFLDWLEQSERKPDDTTRRRTLVARDADRLFSRWSGLPEKLISDDEIADAAVLSGDLEKRVVGQTTACRLAAEVLARFKAGIQDPEKPIGSLLFVGPTGVGKTELAKQLARFVFGSAERLIRVDMSEYLLSSSTYRLLADERGAESLAQRVSQQPLSLVLFDEIEKAHPAVFDLLLGVLGEGRLTATSGRLVDFRMTLIVMTSNLGTGATHVGFGRETSDARDALRAVRDHFRPEFMNRLDHVVPFGELAPAAIRTIVELELDQVRAREGLVRRELRLTVTDEAKSRLAELGFHPKFGARPLKRVIEEQVMTPIAVELSRRPKLANREVRVTLENKVLVVTFD